MPDWMMRLTDEDRMWLAEFLKRSVPRGVQEEDALIRLMTIITGSGLLVG